MSCGIHSGQAVLDLDYVEDSAAGCDGNFVLTDDGNIVEAQVTAEGECYDEEGLLRLLRLARIGCTEIFAAQDRATRARSTPASCEPGKLVIASHNQGKVREIAALLGPYGIEPVSAAELDLPEPEETGTNFIDNADLKARAAADLSGLLALADDSGLCVEALGDRPGIFSARWALAGRHVAERCRPRRGRARLRRAMRGPDRAEALGPEASRNAHFVCALALVLARRPQRMVRRPRRRHAWSGRRAATTASATTRCSCRSATTRPSARWTRTRSTRSATAPTPSASWWRRCS